MLGMEGGREAMLKKTPREEAAYSLRFISFQYKDQQLNFSDKYSRLFVFSPTT